jgi:Fe-S-cluster containining protein
MIADFLKMTVGQLRREYLRRVGLRTTIIEHAHTRDCIFLREADGQRKCAIYPVRPSQCRTWPFWPSNLARINGQIAWLRHACGTCWGTPKE